MKKLLPTLFFLFFSLLAYGQCTVTITASNGAICSGNPVVLTAKPANGNGPYTYAWSTGESTQTITVNKGGAYSVTVSAPGCSATASQTISVANIPDAPTVPRPNENACPNTRVTLSAGGSSGSYQWYDEAGNFKAGGSNFLTDVITVKTIYYVETTVNGCTSARTQVTVYPIGGPVGTGAKTCAGGSVTLTATGAGSYEWFDAPSGGNRVATGASYTTPPLTATRNYYVVGTTQGCVSVPTAVEATVITAPAAPTFTAPSVCAGSTTNVHADSSTPGATFNWYTVPSGGTPFISSPDYTTPLLTSPVTYYVEAVSPEGCVGPRAAVPVTVNPIPAAPTAKQIGVACSGGPATLSATAPAGTYNWYDTPTSVFPVYTGDTYITPVLNASRTYYVDVTSAGGCVSARTPVSVTVNATPALPIISGQTICAGNAATLTPLGPGGNYEWFDAATGGNLLFNGPGSFVTPVLTATTTYYVQTTISGCTSAGRTQVTITVNATPAAPVAGANPPVCAGSAAVLTATGTGPDYQWFDAAVGGNLMATTQSFTTPALTSNTTYYVANLNGTCASPRTAITVIVNPVPAAPAASDATICAGNSTTLTATGGTGTINWYSSPSGGTTLHTGSSFTTPNLSSTTTYYVNLSNNGCASTRTAVTVTVLSTTNQFEYSSGTYCKGAANPFPAIAVPGGTFSAPAGLVINASTGEINLVSSSIGSYAVVYANNCVITSRQVAIVVVPDASFNYSAVAFCQGSADVAPSFTPTSSGGVFTASPAGLVFRDDNRGTINFNASAPGNYTITNTIDGIAGCITVQATMPLRIDPKVVTNAGPDQIVAAGSNAQLAGSVTGGATTGTWSGGSGTFNNANNLNAIYTPGSGETSAVLTLTSTNPGTACGATADQVVITFNPTPPAPTVAPVAGICSGSSAVITATGPGGTYRWYDAATAGNLLATGATFTTPALTANTTYYVATTVNGVTGARTAVAVTVNTIQAAPTVTPVAPVCAGSTVTLTASGGPGTFQWYFVPNGGSVQFTGSNYITQPLAANTSFYVEVVANGCVSPRTRIDVVVNPLPSITSASTANICSGNALNYAITTDLPGTTFSWSRAAVAGVSNAAVTGQTTGTITETLINSTGSNKVVIYSITPMLNGCAGSVFNYSVTVYPTPQVTSASTAVACSGNGVNYKITFNTPSQFTWSRAAVTGISNAAVSGQAAPVINEALVNTTNAPVNVTYIIDYKTPTCTGATFSLTVSVNPRVIISNPKTGVACGGVPQNYVIASNVPSATYSWSRNGVPGISNPPVSSNTSGVIDEALNNTTGGPVELDYVINTVVNGCQAAPFIYTVTVNPQPPTPVANTNAPICSGNKLNLYSSALDPAGSTYAWTGPNGFTSTERYPVINNATPANAGTYKLVLTLNGCPSVTASVNVVINTPSVVNAGLDVTVCPTVTGVDIAGTVNGVSSTGLWKTTGTGTFAFSPDQLTNRYLPSTADIAAGLVKLTLTSTSLDDCVPSVDELTITFGKVPGTNAGADFSACIQFPVPLNGKMIMPGDGKWSTSGTGTFYYGGSPDNRQINGMPSPEYRPSPADIAAGSVKLTLTANNNDVCYISSDEVLLTLAPPPKVNAGGVRYVLENKTIVLTPTVSDENVTYKWTLPNGSAATNLSDPNSKNPIVTGVNDIAYRLTVTDKRGCVNFSDVLIRIATEVVAPNTFTPNSDGINDLWDVKGLVAYEEAIIDIYNRYGQKVYSSIGYSKPWDGTQNGKPVPVGTYYYVINTRVFDMKYTGYVAVLR